MQGDPESALRCYDDLMRQRTEQRAIQVNGAATLQSLIISQGSRQGTQEATIPAVELYNAYGEPTEQLRSGEALTVELEYQLARPLPDMILSLGIYNEAHVRCFETIITSMNTAFGALPERGRLRCRLSALTLLGGRYYVNVGLYPTDWAYVYDYHWQMHTLSITSDDESTLVSGVVALRPAWSLEEPAWEAMEVMGREL